MQMRLDILISRIGILKKRTSAIRAGELITLNTIMSALNDKSNGLDGSKALRVNPGVGGMEEDDDKVEWTKLKLLKETTINDVLLASDTVVSIESKAATSLIEQGFAELIEAPPEETTEEEKK
jgi:hypothetical protein